MHCVRLSRPEPRSGKATKSSHGRLPTRSPPFPPRSPLPLRPPAVSQAYPFVARKVLRNERGTAALLQEMLLDPTTGECACGCECAWAGKIAGVGMHVKLGAGVWARHAPCSGSVTSRHTATLSLRAPQPRPPAPRPPAGGMRAARLNALLNAALGYVASETSGFVDFDAVPEQGASLQVDQGWRAGLGQGLWSAVYLLQVC